MIRGLTKSDFFTGDLKIKISRYSCWVIPGRTKAVSQPAIHTASVVKIHNQEPSFAVAHIFITMKMFAVVDSETFAFLYQERFFFFFLMRCKE